MPRTGPAAAALVLVLLLPPQSDRTAQAVSLPGAKLQALVDHAIASGSKSLTIPPGDYLFNTTRANFEIHGAEGLQILAAGATVWLWPGSFVDVRSSRRTTVSGLTVDYDPPCFSQLVVTAVNSAARSFSATVEPGFLPPDAAKHPQFNATEVKVIYWSAQTRLLLPQPSANPWDPQRSHCTGSACVIALGLAKNPLPSTGDLITIGPRIGANMEIQTWYTSGYRQTNTSTMVTQNVTLHGAGSMGFGEFGGEGGNVYKDCRNIRRPGSSHLLSSNHDGFHSYAVARGPILDTVEIGFCGDDALNIHSVFSLLFKPVSSASRRSFYIIDAGLPAAPSFNARAGDTLDFYDIQTVSLVGSRQVASMSRIDDTAVLGAAASAMKDINSQCAGGCGLFNCSGICGFHFNVAAVWEVALDAALGELGGFELVQVRGRSSGGATIRNCHFHDAYDGVMQLRSSRASVRDNLFERAHDMNVAVGKGWLEGAADLHSINVRDNIFRGCCTPKQQDHPQACNAISMRCNNCTQTNNTVEPS